MFDVKAMLQRQAEWQSSRASRTWAEKIREVERVREGLKKFRKAVPPVPPLEPAKRVPPGTSE